MPRTRVFVDLFPGRTREMKTQMVKELTDVMVNVLGCDRNWVHISVAEQPLEDMAIGGVWADEYMREKRKRDAAKQD